MDMMMVTVGEVAQSVVAMTCGMVSTILIVLFAPIGVVMVPVIMTLWILMVARCESFITRESLPFGTVGPDASMFSTVVTCLQLDPFFMGEMEPLTCGIDLCSIKCREGTQLILENSGHAGRRDW